VTFLEIVVFGTPVSQQTGRGGRPRRKAWSDHVRLTANNLLPADAPMFDASVRVVITHYFASVLIDLDNLAKPILDGLKPAVFRDDNLVDELIVRRFRLAGLVLTSPTPMLVDAVASKGEFVHIRVVGMSETTGPA